MTRGATAKLAGALAAATLVGCAASPAAREREARARAVDAAPVVAAAPAVAAAPSVAAAPAVPAAPSVPAAPAVAAAPSTADAPPAPTAPAEARWTALTPRIRCDRAARVVEFDAVAVLKTGFLEQLVCLVGTREHESLFAFDGKASDVHAALLFVGLEPGAPGQWREVTAEGASRIEGVEPKGATVEVAVLLPDGSAHAIDWFVRAAPLSAAPDRAAPSRFVFGGSRFERSRRTGADRYLADSSGSLIGLVTFGDETIGCAEVVPDQASVAAPVWEAWSERMPEPGTQVRIRLSPARVESTSSTHRDSAPKGTR